MGSFLKRLTLDCHSGHDLMVCEVHVVEPQAGLRAVSAEPAWDSLSLSAPSPHSLSSLKINKLKKIKGKII